MTNISSIGDNNSVSFSPDLLKAMNNVSAKKAEKKMETKDDSRLTKSLDSMSSIYRAKLALQKKKMVAENAALRQQKIMNEVYNQFLNSLYEQMGEDVEYISEDELHEMFENFVNDPNVQEEAREMALKLRDTLTDAIQTMVDEKNGKTISLSELEKLAEDNSPDETKK